MASLFVIAALFGCANEPLSQQGAANLAAIKVSCQMNVRCLWGGFVVDDHGFVRMIKPCTLDACGDYGYSAPELMAAAVSEHSPILNSIGRIVLGGDPEFGQTQKKWVEEQSFKSQV